jgi:plasmid stabilization system protein ParE
VQVVFTPLAVRHIDTLHQYISEHSNEERADFYITRIIQYCKGFATFPYRGSPRDDVLPGLRVAGFRRRVTIAYTVTAEDLLIEGIFYGGQNFESVLGVGV